MCTLFHVEQIFATSYEMRGDTWTRTISATSFSAHLSKDAYGKFESDLLAMRATEEHCPSRADGKQQSAAIVHTNAGWDFALRIRFHKRARLIGAVFGKALRQ